MYALALNSMAGHSPTYDEQGFIVRGLAYLRGENRHMRVGHPLGLNALSALFLVSDPTVKLPIEHPSWPETGFHVPAGLFMWEMGNDVQRVLFLARLPTIWLGLLLAAVCGRWAWQISRNRGAGLVALLLVAFDPNILAHSGLATTDLGLAAAAGLAGFSLWRYFKRPTWPALVVAGLAFGLLQNTKFTAVLFIPLFGLALLLYGLLRPGWRRRNPVYQLGVAALYFSAALLALWAAYGFDVGTLPPEPPAFTFLGGRTLPLAHHLDQFLDIGGRLQKSTPAFLLGQYSHNGWWYYFPVAFVLKTPLPMLLLLIWALLRLVRAAWGVADRQWGAAHRAAHLLLLLPPLGYLAIALASDINLGYRHLLPLLPFLAVFTAVSLAPLLTGQGIRLHSRLPIDPSQLTILSLLLWLSLSSLLIAPHFLAYFNPLAGGPDKGWRALVDSNIDWGQDLARLKQWTVENDVNHIWLSYFGTAWPEYYGLNFTGLDSFPPRLMNPAARPFYPHNPAPGIYAISVTNLQGVLFEDHDLFAWFRQREPLAKIGYSIFIYRVPADPLTVVNLALGGIQPDQIAPADYALLATNNVAYRWFDPAQALQLPAGPHWLILGVHAAIDPGFEPLIERMYRPVAVTGPLSATPYRMYQAEATGSDTIWPLWPSTRVDLRQGDHRIAFTGFRREPRPSDNAVVVYTLWRQLSTPSPVKIFVHLLNGQGELVSQWDGLGAAWEGWWRGDQLVHAHQLPLPAGLTPGRYTLWSGLYQPESGERWTVISAHCDEDDCLITAVAGDNRIYLGEIELP
jgi:hypothetical protein